MCLLYPNIPAQAETITHLFATCQFAQEVWHHVRTKIWEPASPPLPFPTHPYTLTTGDASHLSIPARHFWTYLHALTVSRLYIARCNTVFGRGTAPHRISLIADIIGAVKTDIADCIAAAWSSLKASVSDKGFATFHEIWMEHYPNHYVSVYTLDQTDAITGETGPDHGHRRLHVLKF
jgi:hypothetical protein